jgi:hypothetical protein
MERFNALGRGAQIMLVAGVLLFISLFLPWQDFDLNGLAGALGVDTTLNAWNGFWGWMLGLLTIVLLAWLVVRLMSVNIPLPVSTAMTAALLGVLIVFFAVIKNLADDESTIWSYIGVALAIAVAVGAWMTVQEAGGMETLRSEIPSTPSSTESQAATAPPPTPSERAPEAAPEAPAAPEATEPEAAPEDRESPDEPR